MLSFFNLLWRRVLFRLGMDFSLSTEDRRILEQQIFPYLLSRQDMERILFIGCCDYTRGYNRVFRDKNYQTIDVAPENRKFGAYQHVTDGLSLIHI